MLSRDPRRARATALGRRGRRAGTRWPGPRRPPRWPAATRVVHLAGEPVAQRWSAAAKRAHPRRAARPAPRNLVAGLRARRARARACSSPPRPSATTAHRGDERVDESAPPGDDFLAAGVRRVGARGAGRRASSACASSLVRTGVVLDRDGGALAKMLPPFRLGVGGPVAGGRQYMPWIHVDDLVGLYLAALDGDAWSGPVNAHGARAGHEPRLLARRSAARCTARRVAPVPALALRAALRRDGGDRREGQRAVPARPLELGYAFRHRELDEALARCAGKVTTSGRPLRARCARAPGAASRASRAWAGSAPR